MKNIALALILALIIGTCVFAQAPGLTIDQVEAQVVVLQAQLVPAVTGQPLTVADEISALQTQAAAFQGCCNKFNAPVMLALPQAVTTLQNQFATINLQLSTIGTLTQLSLDNQTKVQAMQAQIATLQAQVAALTPATPTATFKVPKKYSTLLHK